MVVFGCNLLVRFSAGIKPSTLALSELLTLCVLLCRFPCSRGSMTWPTPSCWTCFRSLKDWARKRTCTEFCRTSEAGSKLQPSCLTLAQQRGRRAKGVPALVDFTSQQPTAHYTGSADASERRLRTFYSSRETHLLKCLIINQKNAKPLLFP